MNKPKIFRGTASCNFITLTLSKQGTDLMFYCKKEYSTKLLLNELNFNTLTCYHSGELTPISTMKHFSFVHLHIS